MNDDAFTALREAVMEEARTNAIEQLDAFYTAFPVDSSTELAELWYEGLERSDDIFEDRLPQVDLSGQWAGVPSFSDILSRLTTVEDLEPEDVDDLADTYLDTFALVVHNNVMSTIRRTLGKDDTDA